MSDQPRMTDLKLRERPRDYDPLSKQKELQHLMRNYTPSMPSYGTVLEGMRMNKEAIDVEFVEILDWLACWKHWKASHRKRFDQIMTDEDRTEMLYEVVDIMHFVINMAIILGADWDLLMDVFYTKQKENFDRQKGKY